MVSIRSLTRPFCPIGGWAASRARPGRVGGVPTTTVMWFRRDLRLADNPALLDACDGRRRAAAVRARPRAVGAGRRVPPARYLGASLRALDASLRQRRRRPLRGPRRPGPPGGAGRAARSARAGCTSPPTTAPTATARDLDVEQALADAGIELVRTGSPYAVAPGRVTQRLRRPLQGLHAVLQGLVRARLARARSTPRPGARWLSLDEHRRHPRPRAARRARAARGRRGRGRAGGGGRTSTSGLADYDDDRDRPDLDAHLADVGAPEVGRDPPAHDAGRPRPARSAGAATYRKELAWREFYADVLFAAARDRARVPPPRVRADAVRRAGRRSSTPGGRAAPASRSSTRACGSCGRPAGCTTGCG